MYIKFKPNPDRPSHKDLHVIIPELMIDQLVDTYYFIIDSNFLPGDETEEKVIISLRTLLRDWVSNVDKLENDDTTFIPFDFSDQYVGGVKVQRHGTDVIIRYGWNRLMGGMQPSDYMKGYLRDQDLLVDIKSAVIPLQKFIGDIESQLS